MCEGSGSVSGRCAAQMLGRHEDESPSKTYGLAFGHCATLLDREDFFFKPRWNLFPPDEVKWLAQIKPTDRVCLDLLIKKLEMQDARFC